MNDTRHSLSKDDDLPKSITTKKLGGPNYLAWAHAVKIYLRGRSRLHFLTDSPLAQNDAKFGEWEQIDSMVMGQLWHSLEPHVATTVEFCETSKQIWDSLADSFSN